MFVDKVKVSVAAGDGGDGIVSFRHEIYVDKGGPDGGNGGNGGDVILIASRNQNTLAAFRYQKLIKAANGGNGGDAKKHGRSAKELRVEVPVGTVIIDDNNDTIADLAEDGQETIIAKGGRGGFGNAHFTSSTRQAPRIAEKGEKGEKHDYIFELRMLADVGLVGLPNAGKSSLLAAVSNARPEVADYPFTTLSPHLGVIDVDGDTILMADIPGLIEGASKGKGLGDEFLRHVSRCSVLLHLIDINSNDIASDYQTIRQELDLYSHDLAIKPEIVAITKIETLDDELLGMQIEALRAVLPSTTTVFAISAYAQRGLNKIIFALKAAVNQAKLRAKKKHSNSTMPVITLKAMPESWHITKEGRRFIVTGKKIERFAAKIDFNNDIGIQRIRDIMQKMGIMHQLRRDGITAEDKIIIGNPLIGEIIY